LRGSVDGGMGVRARRRLLLAGIVAAALAPAALPAAAGARAPEHVERVHHPVVVRIQFFYGHKVG